jgi:hypothetical protein
MVLNGPGGGSHGKPNQGKHEGDSMNQGIKHGERVEKMGFETPYYMFTHCRVCGTWMYVPVQDLGKVCPDCNQDQGNEIRKGD